MSTILLRTLKSILERTRDFALWHASTKQLHDTIYMCANELRRILNDPSVTGRQALIAQQLDPVLRYSLLYDLGFANRYREVKEEKEVKELAHKAYARCPLEYDIVLGELIPPGLKSLVAPARFSAGTHATAADDWETYFQRLGERLDNPDAVIRTGLPSLDSALGGGLRGLTILGGFTGVGKTSLAATIAIASRRIHPDLAVCFFELDMAKERLYDRLLCLESGVTLANLESDNWSDEINAAVIGGSNRLESELLPGIRVVERLIRPDGSDQSEYLEPIRELIAATGFRNGLLVVDHLQRLPVNPDASEADAALERLDLLELAQRSGWPILALAQVRKEADPANLHITDLLGSIHIAARADNILMLQSGTAPPTNGRVPISVKVAKARDGHAGTEINLVFEFQRFRVFERPTPTGAGSLPPRTSTRKAKRPAKSGHAEPAQSLDLDPLGGR